MYEQYTKEELIQLIYKQTVTISKLEAEVKQLKDNAILLEANNNKGWGFKISLNPFNWFRKKNNNENK